MESRSLTSADSKIFAVLFGFLAGVLLASFVVFTPLVAVFLIILGLAVLAAEKIYKKSIGSEVFLVAIFIVFFALGALRYDIKDFHTTQTPSAHGVVVSEPELRENFTRFVFESDNGERVLVSTDLYSPVKYGDRVEVLGKLKVPGVIDDEVGRPFDYAKYLSKDDIYYTMSFAKVAVLSHGEGSKVKASLISLKQSFVTKIREILAEPESSLLAGLIVAGKDAMPKNILDEFKRAGVVHIVVLSGYNLTIIADSLRKFFGYFSARAAPWAAIMGVLFFVIMTGAEATVVRAGIMVLAVIAAKILGRNYSAKRALLVAAAAMVMHNPKILVFDPSFQLSFLATLALIYVAPILEKYLSRVPEKFGLRGIVATTLATQITVLPYLAYSMGEVSIVSLITNLLILLVVPWVMFTGFVAALLAYISTFLALPLGYVTHLMLGYILWVSHYFGSLPFAAVKIQSLALWMALLAYAVLISGLWVLYSYSRRSAN